MEQLPAARIAIKSAQTDLQAPSSRPDHTLLGPDLAAGSNRTSAAHKAKQVRVLLAAPSLEVTGGQSRQAARLLERLSEEPSVEIRFVPHNPRLPGMLRLLQKPKYVRSIVTALWYCLLLLAHAWRYDVLHVFCASYYSYMMSALPAILVAKIYRKKIILNYRSGEAEDHLSNWRIAVPTIRMADRVVVPTGYLVDLFARFGLRAHAISNVVELDRFTYRERQPLRPVFLTSRLLEPLYNVPCVLRAFAIIQTHYPEARLTVAGDGWMRPELEQLAKDLGLRNTDFIGFVPFAQMPELYDRADIYLTATDIDNMPSSITECMAAGANVVTTDGGGSIPYIMSHEETGLIVPRGDHEAMAAAAIRLLQNPDFAANLSRNARHTARAFTWPEVKREWLAVYRELAQSSAASRVSPEAS